MAKLSPEEQLERKRAALIKMVFSSISRRIADRAFVSSSSNSILLCNPEGDRENRLVTFLDPDLCVHLVKVKDIEFLNYVKSWVLDDLKYNLVSIDSKLLSTGINKLKVPSACKFETQQGLYRYFTNSPTAGNAQEKIDISNDDDIDDVDYPVKCAGNFIAEVVGDTRTLMTISDLWRRLRYIASPEHMEKHTHKVWELKEIPEVTKLSEGVGCLPIDNTYFGGKGRSEFLITDGRSTPAYKEFILKSRDIVRWDGYVWQEDAKRLGYCTLYEDHLLEIKSWQPNNFVYLFDNEESKWEKIWH